MLTIRLSRIGRKKHPHYRLVIAEKARDTYGHSLEILGHYHPLQKDDKDKLVINKERIEHWLKQGAQTSNTVRNIFIDAGIIKGDKLRTIGTYKNKKAKEESKDEKKDQPEAGEPQAQDKKEDVAKADKKQSDAASASANPSKDETSETGAPKETPAEKPKEEPKAEAENKKE